MRVRYQRGISAAWTKEDGTRSLGVPLVGQRTHGVRVRRKAVICTVKQYLNLENAWQASNGLGVSINETRNRQREKTITVADLVGHYRTIELADDQVDSKGNFIGAR
jgi:hypothetical protein